MTNRPRLLIFAALLLLGAGGCGGKGALPPGAGALTRGNAAYEEQRYNEAALFYREVLEEDSDNVEAHFRLGVIFQKQGSTAQAISAYNTVIRHDPDHAKAHFNLALIYAYEKKDTLKAIYFFERFLELSPGHDFSADVVKKLEILQKEAYGDGAKEGRGKPAAERDLLDLTDELLSD